MLRNAEQDTVNDLDFLTIIKHEIILYDARLSDYSGFAVVVGCVCRVSQFNSTPKRLKVLSEN